MPLILDDRSDWPIRHIRNNTPIPITFPTIEYIPTNERHSSKGLDEKEFLEGFTDDQLVVMALVLRTVSDPTIKADI